MRIGKHHRAVIERMESNGYVWLSNMHINAQMRFRNRTRKGFKDFVKVDNLTFLTKEVADAISIGTKRNKKPAMTLTQQVHYLQGRIAQLEKELAKLKNTDPESLLQNIKV